MRQIASNPSMFYSDNSGSGTACTSAAHSSDDLDAIFRDIVTSFTGTRLLPDDVL